MLESSQVVGTLRLVRFFLDAWDLGVETQRVVPPNFGSTWLISGAIIRLLFLSDQDVVINVLDAPLGGWIEGLCTLGLPVVG